MDDAEQDLPPLLLPLPEGISSRQLQPSPSELSFHILEAGSKGQPLILLVHGFPELAYSWRRVMPLLAKAGYYTVAVDQRGYGRTTGWDTRSFEEVDLNNFSVTNLIRDMVVLVHALGYRRVDCLVGHDFGSVTASLCALTRPDFFKKVVLMSHPFKGSPKLPFDAPSPSPLATTIPKPDIHHDLAHLPTPRKHYKWYYSTSPAATELLHPQSSLHTFLRGYFHLKSADWTSNNPHPLVSWTAPELAKVPTYYIMPLHKGMRETVAEAMSVEDPSVVAKRSARWFPDGELDVYVREFGRTGFQGGLNWYRVQTALNPSRTRDLDVFAGKMIEVPCLFISGKQDWGTYQEPGVVEGMGKVCSDFRGVKIIDGAGHWVQQERPEEVVREILGFMIEQK
ncbi:MAG: hypothetical protein MMC33_006825 [Icmadophila ericetorum]|nr:hypothetical protein [Icmadophila ericetorum]